MVLAAIVIVVLIILALAAAGRESPPSPPSAPIASDLDIDEQSPTELSLSDPVEALLRYGTPADAARLADQGVDLSALGYRAPAPD